MHLLVCASATSTSSWSGLWDSRACMSRPATGEIHIVNICLCFPVMDLHPDQLARSTRWGHWCCLHECWVFLSVLICVAGHVYMYIFAVYMCVSAYWEYGPTSWTCRRGAAVTDHRPKTADHSDEIEGKYVHFSADLKKIKEAFFQTLWTYGVSDESCRLQKTSIALIKGWTPWWSSNRRS